MNSVKTCFTKKSAKVTPISSDPSLLDKWLKLKSLLCSNGYKIGTGWKQRDLLEISDINYFVNLTFQEIDQEKPWKSAKVTPFYGDFDIFLQILQNYANCPHCTIYNWNSPYKVKRSLKWPNWTKIVSKLAETIDFGYSAAYIIYIHYHVLLLLSKSYPILC